MSSNRPVRSKNPPLKLKEYVTNLPSHSPLASRQQGTHGLAGTPTLRALTEGGQDEVVAVLQLVLPEVLI